MDYKKQALKMHLKHKGKLEIKSKVPLKTNKDLSLAYTPGVAEPCLAIAEKKEKVYDYTSRGNTIAIVSDGSRVLGLGNIGPEAALPVMEGKAILFKEFGNVDAFPICLNTQDAEEIIKTVKNIAPVFGGINLEDIASPKCFEIEERLKKELDIPVFHDDQHGTAVVVLAGLINALKLVNKKIETAKIIVNGTGAAGSAIIKILAANKAKNMIAFNLDGVLDKERKHLDSYTMKLAKITNHDGFNGNLEQAMESADVFIGVSAPNVVSEKMVASMAKDSIVFTLANPVPEIMPEKAKKAGAKIVATGRSDYPNQINNLLCFPGLFRGILDARLPSITPEIKIAAAYAIAKLVTKKQLKPNYIIPSALDKNVGKAIAKAIKKLK
ncbi:NADP-dependent malic enzyme [Candidatus Parcubacteria bacterium]|nr:NADP-dependent malic enzyme [Candidatus Parcubacteria bacterium]